MSTLPAAACSRLSASSSTLHNLLLFKGFFALINSLRAFAHSGVVSHDLTKCSLSIHPPFPSQASMPVATQAVHQVAL
eukprot:CAMPEP_0206226282 /NCGR_PEP_ID=MMETSP0047_2-20121206/8009_1 /ASSEMBLY_ACC=CAM_ASM_000192 /TAXON_ID=195065 /ORGANISM="Chroomonas mesostigmatica_cf, Strain CCMP1168" /LENGTH=77 /DNA_ID=CAMNT_0053649361 /DNA_START=322 /DNA_END=552 /DNA_ORIENTATION=+